MTALLTALQLGQEQHIKHVVFVARQEFAHHEVDRSIRGNASCSLKRKI